MQKKGFCTFDQVNLIKIQIQTSLAQNTGHFFFFYIPISILHIKAVRKTYVQDTILILMCPYFKFKYLIMLDKSSVAVCPHLRVTRRNGENEIKDTHQAGHSQ